MYDKLFVMSYVAGHALDIGAGTVSGVIPIPKGARMGRVLDITVNNITEAFAGDDSAVARVGTVADPDKFAAMDIGTAATGAAINFRDDNGFLAVWNAATDDIDQLEFDITTPGGGASAGIATVTFHIGWDFVSGVVG